MHKITGILTLAFIAAVMQGCEIVTSTEDLQEGTARLVVDGRITNEKTFHSVALRKSAPVNYEGVAAPVSGATVSISDGQNLFEMIESPSPGIYQTVDPVQGEPGTAYTLSILIGNKRYTATDTMPPVPIVTPLEYYPDTDPGYYSWAVPHEHTLKPGITYESRVQFIHPPKNGKAHTTELTYYNFTGLNVSALFSLNEMSQIVRFPKGTTIVQEKFALSRSYYRFLKSIYLETDWRGGLYDVTAADPASNLSGGALGFFRATSFSKIEYTVE